MRTVICKPDSWSTRPIFGTCLISCALFILLFYAKKEPVINLVVFYSVSHCHHIAPDVTRVPKPEVTHNMTLLDNINNNKMI